MSEFNDDNNRDDESSRRALEGREYAMRGRELMSQDDERAWPEAVQCFYKAIELSDDPMANCLIGGAYFDGKGVAQSYNIAFKYFLHDGDDLGDPNGMYWSAYCFANGFGVEKSEREADKRLREAARRNLPMAQFEYGKNKIYGVYDEIAVEDGIEYVCLAGTQNLNVALVLMDVLDDDQGVMYFPEERDDDYIPFTDGQRYRLGYGQSRVGMMYRAGLNGVVKDYEKAYHYLSKSVKNKCPEGMFQMGLLYADKDSGYYSPKEAASLMEMAAVAGYAPAERQLGVYYLKGFGIEASKDKAYEWLLKAANDGDKKAKEYLSKYFS